MNVAKGSGAIMQSLAVLAIAGALGAVQMQAPEIDPADGAPPATVAPPAVVRPADPPSPAGLLPALTPVRIEIMATLNSQLNRIGDHFPIRLAQPLTLADGRTVPAGISGSGDVVHAAKSRFAGKPGELVLAVRYLDFGGTRIPLRSLTFPTAQRALDNRDAAFAVAVAVGVLAVFITGGEVNVPAGTPALAKTSAAITLPPPPAPVLSAPSHGEQTQ